MTEQWVQEDVGGYRQNQTFTVMRKNGWHWSTAVAIPDGLHLGSGFWSLSGGEASTEEAVATRKKAVGDKVRAGSRIRATILNLLMVAANGPEPCRYDPSG